MTRSIVLIDTYYPKVITELGFDDPGKLSGTYAENAGQLVGGGFGTGGAYLKGFRSAGWDAHIIVPNARGVQTLWALENSARSVIPAGWQYGLHLARLPIVRSTLHRFTHMHRIVLEQIALLKPDAVIVQDLNFVPRAFAKELKKHSKILVGEIASRPPPKSYFEGYDLIVSALPSIVERVRAWGQDAAYIPLAFDDQWANSSLATSRPIDVIFVGSFSRHQPQTIPLLREVARRVPAFQIYGPASEADIRGAGLEHHYMGQAWGKAMFDLLAQSKIVVNRHGTIAGPHAVNMRMFESTGSGAALVTEEKSNLADLFVPGKEVIAYSDPSDAGNKVVDLLADPRRLNSVAAAGHRRTMHSHTYRQRAQVVIELIEAKMKDH